MKQPDLSKFPVPSTWSQYLQLEREMETMSRAELFNLSWVLARKDLFFLLWKVLSSSHFFTNPMIIHPSWIMDRCKEVQFDSDQVVDIWARFHWKSLIKSFAQPIQEVLKYPSITQVWFSHTRPLAKQFLAQVQREIKVNETLKSLSWDPTIDDQIFPDNPNHLARDSQDEGIIVNRPINPKEATFEAYGLIDSLPTSKHYNKRLLDDCVVPASVTTPEQKAKVRNMWELSQPLGMPAGQGRSEELIHGTFYAYDDLYHTMIKRGYRLRIHPCYAIDEDRTKYDEHGSILKLAHHRDRPTLYRGDQVQRFFISMGSEDGSATAAMQMLCDPSAGTSVGFSKEDLNYYPIKTLEGRLEHAVGKVVILLVDPAGEKGSKNSRKDYTVMAVVGCAEDKTYHLLDLVRDKIGLTERARVLFKLHRQWKPSQVRYEKYGVSTDIPHIKYLMHHEEDYRFKITEVGHPKAGRSISKIDRITRLMPVIEKGRLFLPLQIWYRNSDGKKSELVKDFIHEELMTFPNSKNDDILDALAYLEDPDHKIRWPGDEGADVKDDRKEGELTYSTERYRPNKDRAHVAGENAWMLPY